MDRARRSGRRDIGKWGAFSDSWRASGLRGGDLKPRADEDLSSREQQFDADRCGRGAENRMGWKYGLLGLDLV